MTTAFVLLLLAPSVFAGVGWWTDPDARTWRAYRRQLRTARSHRPRPVPVNEDG